MQRLYPAAAGAGLRVPFGLAQKGESEAGRALFAPWERGPHGWVERLKSGKSFFCSEKMHGDFAGMRPAQGERKKGQITNRFSI